MVTAGGRVLGVTGIGASLDEARGRAYQGVAAISWPGMQVRTDIAQLAAEKAGAMGGTPPEAPTAPTAATAPTAPTAPMAPVAGRARR